MLKTESFTPFMGVVEDIDDPKGAGRYKVRVIGYHTNNKGKLPTDNLNWFYSIVNNSAGINGVGQSPTLYLVGSTVFGYFIDSDLQEGIIIGALSSFSGSVNDTNVLSTNASEADSTKEKVSTQEKGIKTTTGSWDEPATPYNATYPNNGVFESRSGHVIELDDTPGHERVHIYHNSGTFIEIHPDGTIVAKNKRNKYDITIGNSYKQVKGDVNVTVHGDANVLINGNSNTQINGDYNEVVYGNVNRTCYGNLTQLTSGSVTYKASSINLNNGSNGAARLNDSISHPLQKITSASSTVKIGDSVSVPKAVNVLELASFSTAATSGIRELVGNMGVFDDPDSFMLIPDSYEDDILPPSIEPVSITTIDKPTPTGELPVCLEIKELDYELQLSPNYKLKDLSNAVPIFPHDIKESADYTISEIVCNLRIVAQYLLEPLNREWAGSRINSAFRSYTTGRSQHEKGMAVDLQWPEATNAEYLIIAEWISENLMFDQLIFEHGKSIWIHLSFDRTAETQRGQILTMHKKQYESGLKLYYA